MHKAAHSTVFLHQDSDLPVSIWIELVGVRPPQFFAPMAHPVRYLHKHAHMLRKSSALLFGNIVIIPPPTCVLFTFHLSNQWTK